MNLDGLFPHRFEGGLSLREVTTVGANETGAWVQVAGDRLGAGPRAPGVDETQHEFWQVAAEVDLAEQGGLLFIGAWIAGDRARLRRERIADLEERALRTEREAARERRLAAAEERTRIARELHDSAAHAINIILVQAGAARLLHQRNPERSQQAIATIEQVARSTIGEIDRLVRALRDDPPGQPEPADPAALDELLDQHRAAGLAIVTNMRGPRRALPRSVAWATYRILQEALTNAARHGSGSADVAVWFQPDAVEIKVTNPAATNGQSSGGGHGIVGMRERAAVLGGTLETQAGEGAFCVRARLPHSEAAA